MKVVTLALGHIMTTKTLTELNVIWNRLGNVSVDDNGCIQQSFLHFDKGTDREEIWKWMEDQNEHFSIAEKQTIRDKSYEQRDYGPYN